MNSGNVLKANSAGRINELDVGLERKGEIKDESFFYGLSLWAVVLAIY